MQHVFLLTLCYRRKSWLPLEILLPLKEKSVLTLLQLYLLPSNQFNVIYYS